MLSDQSATPASEWESQSGEVAGRQGRLKEPAPWVSSDEVTVAAGMHESQGWGLGQGELARGEPKNWCHRPPQARLMHPPVCVRARPGSGPGWGPKGLAHQYSWPGHRLAVCRGLNTNGFWYWQPGGAFMSYCPYECQDVPSQWLRCMVWSQCTHSMTGSHVLLTPVQSSQQLIRAMMTMLGTLLGTGWKFSSSWKASIGGVRDFKT